MIMIMMMIRREGKRTGMVYLQRLFSSYHDIVAVLRGLKVLFYAVQKS